MFDGLIWYGLGIASVIAIVALLRGVFKHARAVKARVLILSFFLGLFLGVIGVAAFDVFLAYADDFLPWLSLWLMDIHFLSRTYIMAAGAILFAFVFGKTGAYLLRKYLPDKVVVCSALIAALLLILQPIGSGWLKLIGLIDA